MFGMHRLSAEETRPGGLVPFRRSECHDAETPPPHDRRSGARRAFALHGRIERADHMRSPSTTSSRRLRNQQVGHRQDTLSEQTHGGAAPCAALNPPRSEESPRALRQKVPAVKARFPRPRGHEEGFGPRFPAPRVQP